MKGLIKIKRIGQKGEGDKDKHGNKQIRED